MPNNLKRQLNMVEASYQLGKIDKVRRDELKSHYRDVYHSRLGDVVSSITNKIGIKECAGCKKRKQALNELDRKLRGLNHRTN